MRVPSTPNIEQPTFDIPAPLFKKMPSRATVKYLNICWADPIRRNLTLFCWICSEMVSFSFLIFCFFQNRKDLFLIRCCTDFLFFLVLLFLLSFPFLICPFSPCYTFHHQMHFICYSRTKWQPPPPLALALALLHFFSFDCWFGVHDKLRLRPKKKERERKREKEKKRKKREGKKRIWLPSKRITKKRDQRKKRGKGRKEWINE